MMAPEGETKVAWPGGKVHCAALNVTVTVQGAVMGFVV